MADLLHGGRRHWIFLLSICGNASSLTQTQKEALSHITETTIQWYQSVDALPDQPLLIIANEFLMRFLSGTSEN